jgi:hypothetical protein
MDFKAQIEADIDRVFLDTDFFAQIVTVNGKEIKAIFDEEYEVLAEDEAVAIAPALMVKKEPAASIKDDDEVLVGEEIYFVADKIPENDIEIILLKR